MLYNIYIYTQFAGVKTEIGSKSKLEQNLSGMLGYAQITQYLTFWFCQPSGSGAHSLM